MLVILAIVFGLVCAVFAIVFSYREEQAKKKLIILAVPVSVKAYLKALLRSIVAVGSAA